MNETEHLVARFKPKEKTFGWELRDVWKEKRAHYKKLISEAKKKYLTDR